MQPDHLTTLADCPNCEFVEVLVFGWVSGVGESEHWGVGGVVVRVGVGGGGGGEGVCVGWWGGG